MPLVEHSDTTWPLFGKISIGVEGFVYYTHYSSKLVIHELSAWFSIPEEHRNIHNTVLLLAGVFSLILGYLADDVAGKFMVVLLTYIGTALALMVGCLAIWFPNISDSLQTQLFIYSAYCWFPFFAAEATRIALISEQFKLPQSLRDLKMFFFLLLLSRYAGSGVAGLLMKLEQNFGAGHMQLTIRLLIFVSVVMSYTTLLITMRKKIRKKRIEVGIVDNVIACLASALYNKAFVQKKMPADSKWIDYSDAKHYKETKDSAVQLTQMALIFLPFSLFFGLNECLDIIWMEQNEWLTSNNDYISGVSMITIYHAVDILFIPIFEYLIEFVAPRMCHIILTDLQLIGSAIFLLGLAYLSTTLLQAYIENGNIVRSPFLPTVRFFNSMPNNVTIGTPFMPRAILQPGELKEALNVNPASVMREKNGNMQFPVKVIVTINSSIVYKKEDYSMVSVEAGTTTTFILTYNGIVSLPPLLDYSDSSTVLDLVNGVPGNRVAHVSIRKTSAKPSHGHGHGHGHGGHSRSSDKHNTVADFADEMMVRLPEYLGQSRFRVSQGNWEIKFHYNNTEPLVINLTFLPRSVYYILFWMNPAGEVRMYTSTSNKAQAAVIWQALPQIFLRSLADGIGKISTYYFTYTQSPRKLRATAFGVLYLAQYAFPGFFGLFSSFWVQGVTSFILSIYTFGAFLALVLFIYFSLKYEEI